MDERTVTHGELISTLSVLLDAWDEYKRDARPETRNTFLRMFATQRQCLFDYWGQPDPEWAEDDEEPMLDDKYENLNPGDPIMSTLYDHRYKPKDLLEQYAAEYTAIGRPEPDPKTERAAEKRAKHSSQSVLEKAQAIVEERGKTYGTPIGNYTKTAKLWSIIIGHDVTPEQVVQCMIGVKQIRLTETPGHEDSILDIAGYAWVLDEVRKHGTED